MLNLPSVPSPGSQALLLVVAAASLGFAPAPLPRPPRPPVESLMGDWHNPARPSVVVNITPTEFAYVHSGARDNVYKLTLDVRSVPYKYDIRKPGSNIVGIWKIEGDKLTLQYHKERAAASDGGRPSSFKDVKDAGYREVYYRVGARKKP